MISKTSPAKSHVPAVLGSNATNVSHVARIGSIKDSGAFFQVGGLASDLKWGAKKTLLLVSIYFSEILGG